MDLGVDLGQGSELVAISTSHLEPRQELITPKWILGCSVTGVTNGRVHTVCGSLRDCMLVCPDTLGFPPWCVGTRL